MAKSSPAPDEEEPVDFRGTIAQPVSFEIPEEIRTALANLTADVGLLLGAEPFSEFESDFSAEVRGDPLAHLEFGSGPDVLESLSPNLAMRQ